jgi:serine/tyrosine/threonine adenylyltransferase
MPTPSFTSTATALPERFYTSVLPQPVKAPRLLALNRSLAENLNLDADWLASPDGLAMLAGNAFPESANPIAMVYAGHQFGHFSPQLGDGRALLIGEVIDRNGQRRDIQLKGSGPTPYSRMGDGRAAIGPVLREYLVSEAMHALGIPTSRSLAAVATGEWVYREGAVPGGVLTRVATSHIRVGTFQFFASRGDREGLEALARYAIARHYPDALGDANPVLGLLERVIAAQARLIAGWMNIGFIHGVMNTDNMTISGETIDYGPCAFMDAYDPGTVFSAIDRMGRYAYGNQPKIAHWNLARLAEALLPLIDANQDKAVALATDAINRFPALFEAATTAGLRAKLGLVTQEPGDLMLAQDLLTVMAAGNADFTLTLRMLSSVDSKPQALESLRALFAVTGGIDSWITRWRERLSHEATSPGTRSQAMKRANPAVIPRNHLVEAALAAAVDEGDMKPFEALQAALSRPFEDPPEGSVYADPPQAPDAGYRTFCGT